MQTITSVLGGKGLGARGIESWRGVGRRKEDIDLESLEGES